MAGEVRDEKVKVEALYTRLGAPLGKDQQDRLKQGLCTHALETPPIERKERGGGRSML